MNHWMLIAVPAKAAANELLPALRTRPEVGIEEVGTYRKVVLAAPGKPTRRHGTFFSNSA
jgi:hypothetical protein